MSDRARAPAAIAVADAVADVVADALIETQRQILAKLRWVALGLQQDLAIERPGPRGCAVSPATLAEALAACCDRIEQEGAVLDKLVRMRQGLQADREWERADDRERDNGNGRFAGAI